MTRLRTRHPWLMLGAELVFASVLLTAMFIAMFVACTNGV